MTVQKIQNKNSVKQMYRKTKQKLLLTSVQKNKSFKTNIQKNKTKNL